MRGGVVGVNLGGGLVSTAAFAPERTLALGAVYALVTGPSPEDGVLAEFVGYKE